MKRLLRSSQLLCLGLELAVGPRPPLPAEPWFQAQSAHFSFVTDGDERETRKRSQALETLHDILTVLSPDLRARKLQERPQLPSRVYLFTKGRSFQAYSRHVGIEGFFVRHPDGYYLAMDASHEDADAIAFHEYLHQFLEENYPGVPSWLNEGLACFFQTLKREGLELRLGAAPAGYPQILKSSGLLPVARLLGVTPRSPDYTDEPARSRFYASAWLMTDYLMTRDEAGRAQLGRYLDLIRAGRTPGESFSLAFGRTPAAMDQELQDHLNLLFVRKAVSIWIIQFRTLEVDPAFSFAPLSRAETLARLGLLLLSGDPATQDWARRHLDEALALEPGCGPANFGQGLLALGERRLGQVGPFMVKASQADPGNALTHYYAGLGLLLGPAGSGGEARDHLLRSVMLGCPDPDALNQLVSVVLNNDRPSPDDLAKVEEACRFLPGRFDLKFNLARLYLRASRRDLARGHLQVVAGQSADPALAQRAAAQLRALDEQDGDQLRREAMEAFKQKRYAEAVAALERAIGLAADAGRKRGLQEDLDSMKILIGLRSRPATAKAGPKPGP
jgi:tetratricopeptide (TPR) repeat protein